MTGNKSVVIILAMTILIGTTGSFIGCNLPRQPVIKEVRVEIPVEVAAEPVYIDRVVEKPILYEVKVPEIFTVNITREIEIEKIVYRDRTDWQFFETLSEFTEWLEGKLVYLLPPADCDDYARHLQIEAYRSGYILSAQLVDNGNINGKIVSDNKNFHDGIRVDIGNEIYYVEPQLDAFRIIKLCDRD